MNEKYESQKEPSDSKKSRSSPKTTRYPTIASLRGAVGSLDEPMAWSEVVVIAREDGQKPKEEKEA